MQSVASLYPCGYEGEIKKVWGFEATLFVVYYKGQLISKANCQTVNSSKKRTNEFISTTM